MITKSRNHKLTKEKEKEKEKKLLKQMEDLPEVIITIIYNYLNGYPKLQYHKKFEWYDRSVYGNNNLFHFSLIDYSLEEIFKNLNNKQLIHFYHHTLSKHLPYFIANLLNELKNSCR